MTLGNDVAVTKFGTMTKVHTLQLGQTAGAQGVILLYITVKFQVLEFKLLTLYDFKVKNEVHWFLMNTVR